MKRILTEYEKLKEAEDKKLLVYLKKFGKIKTIHAVKLWGITGKAVRLRFARMMREGIIVRISKSRSDPSTHYILKR